MMIECEVKFPAHQKSAALSVLAEQPSDMRPNQYSLEEDGTRWSLSMDEADRSESLDRFLWAPTCGYEVAIDSSSGTMTIFAFSENARGIEKLITDFSRLSVLFAYACSSEERAHRNRIRQEKAYGVHEAWVGREFTRYLPGLYWITLIPIAMMSRFGLALETFRDIALSADIIANSNLLVRLYNSPEDWRAMAGPVDNWCMTVDGCFSKGSLASALGEVSDFVGMSDLLEKYP